MERLDDYYGRIFTEDQLKEELREFAKILPAVNHFTNSRICNRCGSQIAAENKLPDGSFYCRECIILGRNSSGALYYFEQKPFPEGKVLKWQGSLTDLQKEVSDSLKIGVEQKENLLIHAVTGAGKTEIIYETVASVLDKGGAVALASPRIDVCLELYKRFKNDFSCSISLLHGESEPYSRSPLVILTTHQLLKFYKAFDLLIIDEVDAFPFVDNPSLYYAVEQSVKADGVNVFLTATSTEQLDKQVKKGKLKKLHLARRFHASPLVVPKTVWLYLALEKLQRGKLPFKLLRIIKEQRQSQFPLLIFFPVIKLGELFSRCLKNYFLDEKIAFVSSMTENRLEIVEKFRKGQITVLISTTILERGVTFPFVDVFVMMANHYLFTKSSLIQIAGRVGRSAERPTGTLLFFHSGKTKSIRKAISEIRRMNQIGGF
ncbi:DEAD/DEAH box helicase [Streptococcus macacae]|uniref:Helicase C-terminal domain protein n=1 Tax=Streptococcus macacae NCTC 11558 TaxID=764298 RepID=G5JY37_9STRE|nr:DEAD/DEAH box helicase [Streptococcus macacae]EHJ52593.1 helicase C-terminal domain protein [Streptococcus macacae NCTC 11558]SUN77954.1 late competence protein [Streptococcus macacae NCTC 11558]